MKSLFSFLPKGFGSLIDYISPSAFDVVNWAEALKKSPLISKELAFGSSIERLKEQLSHHLPKGTTFIDDKTQHMFAKTQSPKKNAHRMGQVLLEIYFLQLYKGNEVFLDLRKTRFVELNESEFKWKPNGLWYKFSDNFIEGIRQLYNGFYEQKDSALEAGLYKLGLYSDKMPADVKMEMRALLEDHFGQGRSLPMKFSVSYFMGSFDNLFLFLKKYKISLSEDFLFLGIYILTVYMHLEELGEAFDVADAFRLATGKRRAS